jgi:hypothetical protein
MRNVSSLLFAIALSLGSAVAFAHEYKVGTLVIDHPWARATPGGAQVGGGFMIIKNTGTEPDRLIGLASDVAMRGEVHEMTMVDNVMKMRQVEGGLEIPAGGTVELKPGSFHVMFMGLKAPLKEGEPFKGTLTFEKAGAIEVEFKVEKVGASGEGHDHGTSTTTN